MFIIYIEDRYIFVDIVKKKKNKNTFCLYNDVDICSSNSSSSSSGNNDQWIYCKINVIFIPTL